MRPHCCRAAERSIGFSACKGMRADLWTQPSRRDIRRSAQKFFGNSQEAAKFLEQFIAPGDLLLLKGSRGVRMERVLEAIDAQHRRADTRRVPEALETGRKGRS